MSTVVTPAAVAAGAGIRVSSLSDVAAFGRLEDDWNALLRRSRADTVFLTWEWLWSWWEAYGDGQELSIVLLHRGDDLVGIAPFYRVRRWWLHAVPVTELRLLGQGSDDSDYLDLIVAEGEEADVTAALVAHLAATTRRWDVLTLDTVPDGSTALAGFVAAAERHGWRLEQERLPCATIDLPADWDTYVQILKPRMRTKVRALLRRSSATPALAFDTLASADEIDGRLRSLFGLHEARWRRAGQPGVFGAEPKRRFYRAISRRFLDRGWLRFYSLRDGDRDIAHQYCFAYDRTVFLLQEGYDPEYAEQTAGNMLRARVLSDCVEHGVAAYDFLGGAAPHKISWGASVRHMRRVTVGHAGVLSAIVLALPDLKRRLAPTVHRVRRILRAARPGASRTGATSNVEADRA